MKNVTETSLNNKNNGYGEAQDTDNNSYVNNHRKTCDLKISLHIK